MICSNYDLNPNPMLCNQSIKKSGGPWTQIYSVDASVRELALVSNYGMIRNVGNRRSTLF